MILVFEPTDSTTLRVLLVSAANSCYEKRTDHHPIQFCVKCLCIESIGRKSSWSCHHVLNRKLREKDDKKNGEVWDTCYDAPYFTRLIDPSCARLDRRGRLSLREPFGPTLRVDLLRLSGALLLYLSLRCQALL